MIYTILCQHSLAIPSADKERIWKEPSRPCYQAWLSFLTVCHSVGGMSTRCCIVPLVGIDSNRTMAVIRQQYVKKCKYHTNKVTQIILIIIQMINVFETTSLLIFTLLLTLSWTWFISVASVRVDNKGGQNQWENSSGHLCYIKELFVCCIGSMLRSLHKPLMWMNVPSYWLVIIIGI